MFFKIWQYYQVKKILHILQRIVIRRTFTELMKREIFSEVEQGPHKGLYSSQRQLRSGFLFPVGWLVGYGFFWRTGLRIFPIFCMNVPYYKNKKRTRRFFREKSCSLIIHENVFWPFLAIFVMFRLFILADIVYLDR